MALLQDKTMENGNRHLSQSDFKPRLPIEVLGMILLLIMILFLASNVNAQSLSSTVFTEKTVMGQQAGAMVSFRSGSGLYLGVFYQKNVSNQSEVSQHGYELAGVTVSRSFIKHRDFDLAPTIRMGLGDRTRFVLVPGIMASARIKKKLSFSFGSSIRGSEATMMLGLALELPTGAKNGY